MVSRVRLVLAMVLLACLAACSSPDEGAHEFAVWASAEKFVVSVDARPTSDGDISAHLVADGAITDDELVALTDASRDKAQALGISPGSINLIVGNAWGFSIDEASVNVATINALRADPSFVGATVEYTPLENASDYASGLHGTVGSQAALRDGPRALLTAYSDSGGDNSVPVAVATANGAFAIIGEGTSLPDDAIQLWQAVSGRVNILEARAALVSGVEQLDITVGSDEDRVLAESMAATYPSVALTVHR